MSILWSVTINRLHLVSKFDKHGVKISDIVTKIPLTINDLPYVTALMYQRTSTPGEVTITQQVSAFAPSRGKYVESIKHRERVDHYERHAPMAPAHLASEDLTHEAATTGDFAAAITAEMKSAA